MARRNSAFHQFECCFLFTSRNGERREMELTRMATKPRSLIAKKSRDPETGDDAADAGLRERSRRLLSVRGFSPGSGETCGRLHGRVAGAGFAHVRGRPFPPGKGLEERSTAFARLSTTARPERDPQASRGRGAVGRRARGISGRESERCGESPRGRPRPLGRNFPAIRA